MSRLSNRPDHLGRCSGGEVGIEFILRANAPQLAPVAQDARTDVGAAGPDERAILHGDFPELLRVVQRHRETAAFSPSKVMFSEETERFCPGKMLQGGRDAVATPSKVI